MAAVKKAKAAKKRVLSPAFLANSGKGRPKGAANIKTREAKEMIAECFDRIGGIEAFARWARIQPTEFYKHYAKLIPITIRGDNPDGVINITISKDEAKL